MKSYFLQTVAAAPIIIDSLLLVAISGLAHDFFRLMSHPVSLGVQKVCKMVGFRQRHSIMSLNFDPGVMRVLDEIERFGLSHDPVQPDRQLKMLNLERSTAELIHVLLVSSARKRVLEIGTSNGFSAIVIGATLQTIEGAVPLMTIERDPLKVSGARTNIAHANLSFIVQVIQGSATEVVHELGGPFDCVFFDTD